MTTLGDLATQRGETCPDSIAGVRISMVDGDPQVARLTSDDPIALMTAVCLYLWDGNRSFVEGGRGYAILRNAPHLCERDERDDAVSVDCCDCRLDDAETCDGCGWAVCPDHSGRDCGC